MVLSLLVPCVTAVNKCSTNPLYELSGQLLVRFVGNLSEKNAVEKRSGANN